MFMVAARMCGWALSGMVKELRYRVCREYAKK
jgi:hypothetical protein